MTLSPEQFNKLVTKEEFNEFKEEMMDMKKDVKKILTSVDGIAKKHQTFEIELTANQAAHDCFEKRIKVLEEK